MWNNHYIPTPWKLRWTRFCYRGLPMLGFVGCLAATLWLWQRQGRVPTLAGEVLAMRLDVTSGRDGVLVPLARESWNLYDTVEANQIIARLDDRTVLAQLDVGRKELVRIRADLDAAVEPEFSGRDRSRSGLTLVRRPNWPSSMNDCFSGCWSERFSWRPTAWNCSVAMRGSSISSRCTRKTRCPICNGSKRTCRAISSPNAWTKDWRPCTRPRARRRRCGSKGRSCPPEWRPRRRNSSLPFKPPSNRNRRESANWNWRAIN